MSELGKTQFTLSQEKSHSSLRESAKKALGCVALTVALFGAGEAYESDVVEAQTESQSDDQLACEQQYGREYVWVNDVNGDGEPGPAGLEFQCLFKPGCAPLPFLPSFLVHGLEDIGAITDQQKVTLRRLHLMLCDDDPYPSIEGFRPLLDANPWIESVLSNNSDWVSSAIQDHLQNRPYYSGTHWALAYGSTPEQTTEDTTPEDSNQETPEQTTEDTTPEKTETNQEENQPTTETTTTPEETETNQEESQPTTETTTTPEETETNQEESQPTTETTTTPEETETNQEESQPTTETTTTPEETETNQEESQPTTETTTTPKGPETNQEESQPTTETTTTPKGPETNQEESQPTTETTTTPEDSNKLAVVGVVAATALVSTIGLVTYRRRRKSVRNKLV